jgi:hypothetical protein
VEFVIALASLVGPSIGGPSIKPIEPLLDIRRSSRDAARSEANVANISESTDAMPSMDGK